MRIINLFGSLVLMASAVAAQSATELLPGTLKAWQEYLRSADARMQARLDARRPFLWIDESPDLRPRVRRGEVVVAPVVGHGTQSVPNGLIHDWIGAVFIPHATIESLFHVVHDYTHYKDFYKPVVADSKVLVCSGAEQEVSMVWQRHILFVNAALESRYRAHEFAIDRRHGYSVADTTQIRQIEGYGQAGQHLLPPDTGSGLIWRMHSITRYEERDGGVYLELEGIALTRDIPASLRWLLCPLVNHLSTNALATTLRQTRDAVNSLSPGVEGLALCPGRTPKAANTKTGGEE